MSKFLLFFILTGQLAFSQCFDNVLTQGSSGIDYLKGSGIDSKGNLYVAFEAQGAAVIGQSAGSISVMSGGNYLVKYSSQFNAIWIKKIPAIVSAIKTDSKGNTYLTGKFVQTQTFGEGVNAITLSSYNNTWDIFVAKYDSAGNLLWARKDGGEKIEYAKDIAIDKNGNCFVAGNYYWESRFGDNQDTILLKSNGDFDVFTAAYDSSGNFKWVRSEGTVFPEESQKILATYNGEAIAFSKGTYSNTNQSGYHIIKYDQEGNKEWHINEPGDIDFGGVESDQKGMFYVTGGFFGQSAIGNHTYTSSDLWDLFLAKYDSTGTLVKIFIATGNGSKEGGGMSIDYSTGNISITGSFDKQISFSGPKLNTTFTNITQTNDGEAFIASFDSSLTPISASHIFINGYGGPVQLFQSQNKLFVTGWFDGNADFPTSSGTSRVSAKPGYPQNDTTYWADFFLATYDPSCSVTTGVQNTILNKNYFNIYPVPSNGNLKLDYFISEKDFLTIEIYDINGKLIYQTIIAEATGKGSRDFSLQVSPGIYNVIIKGRKNYESRKIVIE